MNNIVKFRDSMDNLQYLYGFFILNYRYFTLFDFICIHNFFKVLVYYTN